jgi:hypothetical protein
MKYVLMMFVSTNPVFVSYILESELLHLTGRVLVLYRARISIRLSRLARLGCSSPFPVREGSHQSFVAALVCRLLLRCEM